jgi:hypothetical protein
MRDKMIDELIWDDIDVMIKASESADFWYFREVLKYRKPYNDWTDDELLQEYNERKGEVTA